VTLAVKYHDIRDAVGHYLGYGRSDYSQDQLADIEACIESGLRQFYNPPPVGEGIAHRWSFLQPTASLQLAADQDDYDLPEDLGGITGSLTYPAQQAKPPIVLTSEAAIRRLRGSRLTVGPPRRAAVRPKATDGQVAQGYELMVWPTPQSEVDICYQYYVQPHKLSSANPYPYGGPLHGETVMQSCLAAAELRLNDIKGPHWQQFMERLAASVLADRINGPDNLGYNADRSDGRPARPPRFDEVTYIGPITP